MAESEELRQQSELAEEDDLYEVINKMISHEINAGDIQNLGDARFYTYNDLMMQTKKNSFGIGGVSEVEANNICKAVEKILTFGYIRGSAALLEVAQISQVIEIFRTSSVILITTESPNIEGGIVLAHSQSVSESAASGHHLLSFLPGFPVLGNRRPLIVASSLQKFAIKIASTSEMKSFISFITSLKKCVIIFVDKEQIYFNELVEVEFQDYQLSKKAAEHWKKEREKGTLYYQGITSESIESARKDADFWASVCDRAKENLLKKACTWDPNPSKFTFVLRNKEEWEAVKYLKDQGIWKGSSVQLSRTMTVNDKKVIKGEVACIKGLEAFI